MSALPTLLARTLLDLNGEFDEAAQDEKPLSLMLSADLLRAIPDEGVSVKDLGPALRISRRALRGWLGLEKKGGWFTVEAIAPRGKVVALTERGRRLRDRGAALVDETERAWQSKVGAAKAKRLRSVLETIVSQFDLELPHYPITYGPVDPSAVGGGGAVRGKPGPPRIPPHGADWAPVVRDGGDTVSALPLHALVSQALVAFTIDYEERMFPMAWSALLASSLPDGSAPMEELPEILGVNGLGKSLLERHGIVKVTGKDKKVANLTPIGLRIRDAHEPMLAAAEALWRERYGTDVVDELVAALDAVRPKLAPDLPDWVFVRFAVGIGFADVSLTVR